MFTLTVDHNTLTFTGSLQTIDINTIQLQLPTITSQTITVNLQNIQIIDTNIFWFFNYWAQQNHLHIIYQNLPSKYQNLPNYLTHSQSLHSHTIINTWKLCNLHFPYQIYRLFIQIFLYKNNFNRTHKHLIWTNFLSNISEIGIKAIPVFTITAFFIGIVIMFQSAYQMSKFSAELFSVDFLTIAIFRELGPILTGILLASRSASAITAQLGIMKNNEELMALNIIGLNPIKFLILPKIIALILLTPILTLYVCIIAMFGGLLIFAHYLNYPYQLFFNICLASLNSNSFWMFAWKGLLFGLIIGLISCTQGLTVEHGSINLSQKITASVVSCLITILFVEGILAFMTN